MSLDNNNNPTQNENKEIVKETAIKKNYQEEQLNKTALPIEQYKETDIKRLPYADVTRLITALERSFNDFNTLVPIESLEKAEAYRSFFENYRRKNHRKWFC